MRSPSTSTCSRAPSPRTRSNCACHLLFMRSNASIASREPFSRVFVLLLLLRGQITIVRSLQRQGHICSMTGDGVNDVCSLLGRSLQRQLTRFYVSRRLLPSSKPTSVLRVRLPVSSKSLQWCCLDSGYYGHGCCQGCGRHGAGR